MFFFRKKPDVSKAVPPQISTYPDHVAVIMDGNGRWAQKKHLPRIAGHRAGTENIRSVIELFARYKIKYLTLYAFSTENWNRPESEVNGLMGILIDVIEKEALKLNENNVKIQHLGYLPGLSAKLQSKIAKAVKLTASNTGLVLSVAFNYGGRSEILEAVRKIINDAIPSDKIDEEMLGNHLYTAGTPDPDFIIRTGGEMRMSNFLVWQSVYSEYYSTPVLWPNFDKKEIDKALVEYSRRKRRFGALDKGK